MICRLVLRPGLKRFQEEIDGKEGEIVTFMDDTPLSDRYYLSPTRVDGIGIVTNCAKALVLPPQGYVVIGEDNLPLECLDVRIAD